MADSLREQLIRAGLAKPQGARKKRHAASADAEIDLARAYKLRKAETEREQQDRKAQKLAQERRRKAINKTLRALVEKHAVRDPQAELSRNFMFKGRIRKVLVNREQLRAVNAGELLIVYLAGRYHLVPAEHCAEVQKLAPDHLPDLGGGDDPAEDEFPVPDDLVW